MNFKQKAFFRFEASPTIGAGHAIRSCVLADALIEEGWNCKIVTLKHSIEFIENLKKYEVIDPEDFYELVPEADLLVVDNYDLDESYEKHFRKKIKKILVIDDLANRKHDCDLLVDQTYGRETHDYKHLVPDHCKILTGSDYILLRKEFIEMRPKALQKRRETKKVERILISMGGSDPKNYTLKALELVKESGFTGNIDIVLGFSAPNMKVIKDYISGLPNACAIHTNANMPQLIYEADLAIGAAGSSVWERCCLGLPQYLIQTADNQKQIIKLFEPFETFDIYLKKLNHKYNSETALKIPNDSIKKILSIINIDNESTLCLRDANINDEELLFKWANDEEVRAQSFVQNNIRKKEHHRWFLKKINDTKNTQIYIAENNKNIPIGQVRFERLEDGWYIDYSIDVIFRGFKLAHKLVASGIQKLRSDITNESFLFAQVKSDNYKSCSVFDSLNFAHSSEAGGVELSIAICSDQTSWINEYIPDFILNLLSNGHKIEWAHDADLTNNNDICFYFSYGKIVKKGVLEKHKHNLVVHESALPKGKGWSPATWQILEGSDLIPVTLFEAVEEIDSGDIYLQSDIQLSGHELIKEWQAKLAEKTFELSLSFLKQYPDILTLSKKQEGESSFYRRRTPEDSRLDINTSLIENFNLLRVVDNDRYHAYFELHGYKYKLQISKAR